MQLQLFLLLSSLCPRRIFLFFFSGNFHRGDTSLERQVSRRKKYKKKKKLCEVNLWIQIEPIGKLERSRRTIKGGYIDTFGVRF